MKNRTHTKNLKVLVGDGIPMFSVIVFSERCTLKSISVKSNAINVVKRDSLFDLVCNICSNSNEIRSDDEVSELYLYPYTQVSEAEKNVQYIKNNILQE